MVSTIIYPTKIVNYTNLPMTKDLEVEASFVSGREREQSNLGPLLKDNHEAADADDLSSLVPIECFLDGTAEIDLRIPDRDARVDWIAWLMLIGPGRAV